MWPDRTQPPRDDAEPHGWDGAAGEVIGFAGAPPPGLLRRTGLSAEVFAAEWSRRTVFLAEIAGQERQDRAVVRQQIANFRH